MICRGFVQIGSIIKMNPTYHAGEDGNLSGFIILKLLHSNPFYKNRQLVLILGAKCRVLLQENQAATLKVFVVFLLNLWALCDSMTSYEIIL